MKKKRDHTGPLTEAEEMYCDLLGEIERLKKANAAMLEALDHLYLEREACQELMGEYEDGPTPGMQKAAAIFARLRGE